MSTNQEEPIEDPQEEPQEQVGIPQGSGAGPVQFLNTTNSGATTTSILTTTASVTRRHWYTGSYIVIVKTLRNEMLVICN